jgi:hypothetical protein
MALRLRVIPYVFPALLAGGIAFAPAAFAQERDYTIVPGERVGPIELGMSEIQLLMTVGNPDTMLMQGSDTFYSWGTLTARVGKASGSVEEITLNDPGYQTQGRIHVGSADLTVTAIMGQPSKRSTAGGFVTLSYDGIDILERNNAVMQIRVRK